MLDEYEMKIAQALRNSLACSNEVSHRHRLFILLQEPRVIEKYKEHFEQREDTYEKMNGLLKAKKLKSKNRYFFKALYWELRNQANEIYSQMTRIVDDHLAKQNTKEYLAYIWEESETNLKKQMTI